MNSFNLGGNSIRYAFISGLWGDDNVLRRPKVRNDIRKMLGRRHQPYPRFAYCYGRENYEFVRSMGVASVLIDEAAVCNFHGAAERNPNERGNMNYGVAMWRHKLEIIHHALQQFEAVVWLDWDSWLLSPLPDDFWHRLSTKAEMQASLRQYRRKQCRWRKKDQRKVPSAAWIYVRGREFSEKLLKLYDQFPHNREEHIMVRGVEQELGGWKGVEGYVQGGFEPYCFYVRGQVTTPEVRLFDAR